MDDAFFMKIALELAKQIPLAKTGYVEIRPMVDFSSIDPGRPNGA